MVSNAIASTRPAPLHRRVGMVLFLALAALTVLSACSEESGPSARVSAVNFPDPNMQACVDTASATFVNQITALDCVFFGIIDLAGIQNLTELRTLNLPVNGIEFVGPLGGLTKLTFLNLAENRGVSNIAPLSNLIELRSLNLTENSISDLAPLGALPNLVRLEVGRNPVGDAGLAGLASPAVAATLQFLLLDNNGVEGPPGNFTGTITNAGPFGALVNLAFLDLANNSGNGSIATGVASLSTLVNALEIALDGNPSIPCGDISSLRAALPTTAVSHPCP